jgi:hypothetical protein
MRTYYEISGSDRAGFADLLGIVREIEIFSSIYLSDLLLLDRESEWLSLKIGQRIHAKIFGQRISTVFKNGSEYPILLRGGWLPIASSFLTIDQFGLQFFDRYEWALGSRKGSVSVVSGVLADESQITGVKSRDASGSTSDRQNNQTYPIKAIVLLALGLSLGCVGILLAACVAPRYGDWWDCGCALVGGSLILCYFAGGFVGHGSAFPDRRSEDIRIQSVIILELEFGNKQRQLFTADLVIRPDHAALDLSDQKPSMVWDGRLRRRIGREDRVAQTAAFGLGPSISR